MKSLCSYALAFVAMLLVMSTEKAAAQISWDNGYPEVTWPKKWDPFPNWGPFIPRPERPIQWFPPCWGMPAPCRTENLDRPGTSTGPVGPTCPRPYPVSYTKNGLWCRGPGPNSAVEPGHAACFEGFGTWQVCTGVSDGSDPSYGNFRSNGVPCTCPAFGNTPTHAVGIVPYNPNVPTPPFASPVNFPQGPVASWPFCPHGHRLRHAVRLGPDGSPSTSRRHLLHRRPERTHLRQSSVKKPRRH